MSFLSLLGKALPIIGTVGGTAIGGPLGPIIGSALGSAGGTALQGGTWGDIGRAGAMGGVTGALPVPGAGAAAKAGGDAVLSGATREVGRNAVKQGLGDQLKHMLPQLILGGLGGAALGGAPGAMLGAGGVGLMQMLARGQGMPQSRPVAGPEVSWGAPSVFDQVALGLGRRPMYGPER